MSAKIISRPPGPIPPPLAPEPPPPPEPAPTPALSLSPENRKELKILLKKLAKLGIETIKIEFSGGGDSGDTEPAVLTPVSKEGDELVHTTEAEGLFDRILTEDNQYDWWNNEGGFGSLTINVKTKTIDLDMNVNVQSSEAYPMVAQL